MWRPRSLGWCGGGREKAEVPRSILEESLRPELGADADASRMGVGGILRPMGARRKDLNVRVSALAAALKAVPQNFWLYGRVVAVEEAHEVPVSARFEVGRNMETVIKTLNDLGVVVYEWSDSGRS